MFNVRDVTESKWNLNPSFKPKLKPKVFLLNRLPVDARVPWPLHLPKIVKSSTAALPFLPACPVMTSSSPSRSSPLQFLGPNSIETIWLEFRLEKRIEIPF